jgi:hypothetical protein
MSKFNDANRLFLRGQFTLHQNTPELNWQWAQLPHMTAAAILSRMNKVIVLFNKHCPIGRLKRLTFISAEGVYSTHIFESGKFNVLVTGRMMSDRVTKPVIWDHGLLLRCQCNTVADCVTSALGDQACLSPPPVLESLHIEMSLMPFQTSRHRDCGMNWLSPKDRLCGFVNSSKTVLTNDAVLLKVYVPYNCRVSCVEILFLGISLI